MARKVRIPVAVPLEGSFEKVVKVMTLPDTPAFQHRSGVHFDLGYLSRTDGTGEWIGFIKSNTQYLPLGPDSLNYIMENAGLSEMPPVPIVHHGDGFPDIPINIVVTVLGLLVLILLMIMMLNKRRNTVRIVLPKAAPAENAAGDKAKADKAAWVKSAHAKVTASAAPIESAIIRAARERAARAAAEEPAQRGRITKSPELMNRPAFGRAGGDGRR